MLGGIVEVRISRIFVVCAMSLAMTACEAPLEMRDVERGRANLVKRVDTFQGAAMRADGSSIVVGGNGVIIEYPAVGSPSRTELINAQGVRPDFVDITICPDQTAYALSMDASIWRQAPGTDWQYDKIGTEEQVQSIACSSAGALYVSASFGSMLSKLAGDTDWAIVTREEDFVYTDIRFSPDGHGYVVGEFGSFAHSADDGENWENLDSLPDDFYPLTLLAGARGRVWIGGLDGTIFYSSDFGQTWTPEKVASAAPIYRLSQIGQNYVAVGGFGTVLTRSASGWVLRDDIEIGTPGYLRALAGQAGKAVIAGQSAISFVSLAKQ